MNNRGYATNQATSYGANQLRPISAAFVDNSLLTSRNALSGIATPPGTLAELKLKAKESILAKKAQNFRSLSQDTTLQPNGTESAVAVVDELPTLHDASKTRTETTESNSFALREELGDPTKSSSNTRTPLTRAPKVCFDHPMVNKNLTPIKDDDSAGLKASSVELEDLLAEGRAAAERRSRFVLESAGLQGGVNHWEQTSTADNRMRRDQAGAGATAKCLTDQRASTAKIPYQLDASRKEHNETGLRTQRPVEELPTRQAVTTFTGEKDLKAIKTTLGGASANDEQADKDIDMSDAPNSGNLGHHGHQTHESHPYMRVGSQEQIRNHKPGVVGVQYNMDDMEEWLVMTGFYDDVYRQKVLNRRRRMRAIEEERLQLLLEEQADQDQRSQLVRSQSTLAAKPAPVSPFLTRPPSALPILAPPMASSGTNDLGLRIKDSALKNDKPLLAANLAEPVARTGSLKRQSSPSNMKEEDGQVRKIVRTESNDDEASLSRRAGNKASVGSPLVRQQSPRARTERFVEEQHPSDPKREGDLSTNHSSKRKYDQWVPDKPAMREDHRRSPTDGRNVRSFDLDRRANRPAFNSGHRDSDYQNTEHRPVRHAEQDRFRRDSLDDASPTKQGINLRVNNVRYFLIKSWNYENIETAQRECTWCTQTKNEDLFVDAFRNSRHVILIFSANNSHAFQGYARMQCLPGDPGVTDPTWRKHLHWPTTKPFKIRWITKGDSAYRVAGNLRNPLNDDSLVFVGRDGQEIPDRVGVDLCEALDQDARYRGNKMDY